jgi:hypothetical protein
VKPLKLLKLLELLKLLKLFLNIMKKVYIAPQTEAIQLLAENAIMMASPGATNFNMMYGNGDGGDMR